MAFKVISNIDFSTLEFQASLASGCYGGDVSVYRNRQDGRRFVVKSIPYKSPSYAFETVLKEHTVLSQINHPRICRYYGFYQTRDSWNIVTAYAEKGNLAQFLRRHAKQNVLLCQRMVMAKFADLADGLLYLHRRSIIHRDLKPENVLVGLDNRLLLADFGVSKICCDTGSVQDELDMTIVGTPIYMAPEVAAGKRYDYKSDIWPLGIIFYELCMLEHPFLPDMHVSMKDFRHFRDTYVPIIDYRANGYSAEVQTLCDMMIQPNPAQRWSLSQILSDYAVRKLLARRRF